VGPNVNCPLGSASNAARWGRVTYAGGGARSALAPDIVESRSTVADSRTNVLRGVNIVDPL
jgi:hypothetical protein